MWPVLLYGSETWTISKKVAEKIEVFEMWCWRRLLKISWMERISNEEVLRRMDCERELMVNVRVQQMRFLGHVMRREELENLSLTGRIPGSRARGRQREKYMDGIVRIVGGERRAGQLLQMTREREVWQSMVANACRGTASVPIMDTKVSIGYFLMTPVRFYDAEQMDTKWSKIQNLDTFCYFFDRIGYFLNYSSLSFNLCK